MENQSIDWNHGLLRTLRLRLGWCKSDLARRLNCSAQEIEMWESGQQTIQDAVIAELEFLLRQADAYSLDVKAMPVAENHCDQHALEQIEFSRVKAELE